MAQKKRASPKARPFHRRARGNLAAAEAPTNEAGGPQRRQQERRRLRHGDLFCAGDVQEQLTVGIGSGRVEDIVIDTIREREAQREIERATSRKSARGT